jgi:predicted small secreted protein
MIRLSAILATLALALGAFAVSSCNTIHGLGRDIEATGRAIANIPDGDHRQRKSKARTAQAQTPATPQTQPTAQNPPPRPPRS